MQSMDSYKVWDDGISPICFVALSDNFQGLNSQGLIEKIRMTAKRVSKRQQGSCYIILNLSSVPFSEDGQRLIKSYKKALAQTYVKAIAIIGFSGMKFKINLQDFDEGPKMKWFNFFEEALSFVIEQISVYC